MTNKMTILDMRGIQCPMPVIEAKKALEQAAAGETVSVRVDNKIAVENLRRLAGSMGVEMKQIETAQDDYTVQITASPACLGKDIPIQASQLSAPSAQSAHESSHSGKGLVVVIPSDKMGEPEAELGGILMKGFLYALSRQELLPETIIFYNGGARVTAGDSDSLEDLKRMEEQGVEILTCGTCLKFLGLEDKLQVGSVSNMYEIAEKLTAAARVLRP